MDKPRFLANIFSQICQERDNIMFGFTFNFINSVNVMAASVSSDDLI